jgi:L,D-transpeptidase YcbB
MIPRSMTPTLAEVLVTLSVMLGSWQWAAAEADLSATIAERLAKDADHDQIEGGKLLAQRDFLNALYATGGYQPLWSVETQAERFLALIAAATEDGLDPEDYHLARLRRLLADRSGSVPTRAELDILLTESFARFAYNLRFGKANPQEIDDNWNFSRAMITGDPAAWLVRAIRGKAVAPALESLRPNTPVYRVLKSALAEYRAIAARGDWPRLPAGPTLEPGMRAPAVAGLRERLAATGLYTPRGGIEQEHYDPDLALAVRAFQRRHGLVVDGLVGPRTRAALNVGVAARIDQLRVNLERIRWVYRDLQDRFLAVNIASFHAAYLEHGRVAWRARVVVGQPYRQTPIFKATMTHIVFNPTWTVPPTILRQDVLPAMREDQGYLRRKGLQVLDASGQAVDPATIDWQTTLVAGFPYVLRQAPGPDNALGRVKFMFPNPHLVYLHDTPRTDLFERAERTFSSGCIRVERPLDLAALLLALNPGWTEASMADAMAAGRPRRVDLTEPVTVMLLYLTAFADDEGALQFRRDVYDRDGDVLRALDAPFRFVPPRGFPPAAP